MKKLAILLALSVFMNLIFVLYFAFGPHSSTGTTDSVGAVQLNRNPLKIDSATAPDGTQVFNLRELQRAVPGHSREAVRSALGVPTSLGRGGASGMELWDYKKKAIDPISDTVNDFTVRFDDDKAVDVIL